MKLSLRHDRVFLSAALASLVSVVVPWSASCATTDEETAPRDEASTLPGQDGSADGGVIADADADGGCDAADDNCVTRPVTCEEAPWCPVPTTVSAQYALTAIWGSGKNDVWAVGSGGTIIHYDGTAWKATPTNLKQTFRAVWGRSASDIWAVATADIIVRSSGFANGAATWKPVPGPMDEFQARPIFALWGTPAGDVRMGGYGFGLELPGDIFTTGNQFTSRTLADGGVAWSGVEGTAVIKGIWGSSADDVWIVADNSDTVPSQLGYTAHGTRSPDAGAADAGPRELTWTQVDSQASVVLDAVWGSSANDVWAVGDKGTLRHMTTGAAQWQIVESPTTGALHAVWGSSANDVWAVGDFGTIIHFDGTKWTESAAAFPVNKKRPHLYGVWGSGPSDVWIVGDGISLHYTGPKAAGGGDQ